MKRRLLSALAPELALALERDLLRRGDLHLVAVRSIEELCAAGRDGAELCLIESLLPDGDALDALEAIRATPGLDRVPVVLVAPRDAHHDPSAGFAAVIELPMAADAFDELIGRLLAEPRRGSVRRSAVARARDEAGAPLGRAVDLSLGGLALHTRRALPVGARLSLSLEVLGFAPLTAQARVVRCAHEVLALALEQPSAELAAALADAIVPTTSGGLSFRPLPALGARAAAIGGALTDGPAQAALRTFLLAGDAGSPARLGVSELVLLDERGLDRWLALLDELSPIGPLSIHGCPPWLGALAGRIPAVLGAQARISTLRVALRCTVCGDESEDETALPASTTEARAAVETLASVGCFVCTGALALVEPIDISLAFLRA